MNCILKVFFEVLLDIVHKLGTSSISNEERHRLLNQLDQSDSFDDLKSTGNLYYVRIKNITSMLFCFFLSSEMSSLVQIMKNR